MHFQNHANLGMRIMKCVFKRIFSATTRRTLNWTLKTFWRYPLILESVKDVQHKYHEIITLSYNQKLDQIFCSYSMIQLHVIFLICDKNLWMKVYWLIKNKPCKIFYSYIFIFVEFCNLLIWLMANLQSKNLQLFLFSGKCS